MKTLINYIVFVAVILSFLLLPASTYAVEDPLAKPNNKIGIHILFTHELDDAATLVNANGGQWGYVTIPIQSGDKDLEKWQNFMNDAKKHKVIPVIRLATEGDYFNTKVWRKPSHADIIDFANFLNSLEWPTKNRYIIVFNEVNRGDEWGGGVNPEEYADLLSYAAIVFKAKNQDFFIISAGLDNAAPNQGSDYMNQYAYMRQMNETIPGIFGQIDGLGSHSYPNPGFSQPPGSDTSKSISSFKYERDLAKSLGGKMLPVFITETGWTSEKISDEDRAKYYNEAFATAWSDAGIVTVTPFLLHAGAGPFSIFSFLREDGSKTKQYETFFNLQKVSGQPTINEKASAEIVAVATPQNTQNLQSRDFTNSKPKKKEFSLSLALQDAFRWIMKL